MKVFVTGATGYIGSAVAAAYRRAGHQVFGLTRSMDRAAALERQEIVPVLGSLQDPASWSAVAERAAVLVHAAVDYETDTMALDRAAVEALIALAQRAGQVRTLIYTSGVWVYGDTAMADESTALNPPPLVAARPAVERRVLTAERVNGVVIRPGVVYGGRGGIPGAWFAGAESGALQLVGDGGNRWAMVHVEDLADLYLRAGEQAVGGEVFNAADHSTSSVGELVAAVVAATGYRDQIRQLPLATARELMGEFAGGLALDQRIDASKAARLLGWQPRHRGFAAEVDRYWRAWRASR